MERSWLETMQLLGLDVVLAASLALVAADWVARRFVRKGVQEALARTRKAVAPASYPVAPAAGPAWPPGPWRTSH
jgi:hypothetical protein